MRGTPFSKPTLVAIGLSALMMLVGTAQARSPRKSATPDPNRVALKSAATQAAAGDWASAANAAQAQSQDRAVNWGLRTAARDLSECLFWLSERRAVLDGARLRVKAATDALQSTDTATLPVEIKALAARSKQVEKTIRQTRRTLADLQGADDPMVGELDTLIAEFDRNRAARKRLAKAAKALKRNAKKKAKFIRAMGKALVKFEKNNTKAERALVKAGAKGSKLARAHAKAGRKAARAIKALEKAISAGERAGGGGSTDTIKADMDALRTVVEVSELVLGS